MKTLKTDYRLITLAAFSLAHLVCWGATYTVTTTNDTGPNSLRAIITTANGVAGPHTISFGNTGHFAGGGTINLLSPLPVITQSTSITGWRNPGAGTNAIAITGSAVVFGAGTSNSLQELDITGAVTNGQNLSVTECVITGGGIQSTGALQVISSSVVSSPSAGVRSSGNATLNDVSISLCSAGGIHNEGTMAIASCVISNNMNSGDGGGIYTSNSFQATGCQIVGNSTSTGRGGGIFNAGTASIVQSTIWSNTAYSGFGGGFYDKGRLSLVASVVAQNISKGQDGSGGGGGAACWGGGVYLDGSTMTATNTTFCGNQATAGNGATGFGGKGGGLYGGSGGPNGTAAGCGWPGTSGGSGQAGGFGSGGGGGGAGGAAYPGQPLHQTSCCYKFCNWNGSYVTYGCGCHNVTLGGGVWHGGYDPCPNTLPSINLKRCPYYTEASCDAYPGGGNGAGGNGGYAGGGGYPGGTGGYAAGAATSTSGGGGASFGSGIYVKTSTVTLVNCTLAQNQGNGGTPGGHGIAAVFNDGGQVVLLNTIVGANASTSGDGPDVNGVFTSLGHNFIGTTAGSSGWDPVWDYQNSVPLSLGALQDNGGPTYTCALLPGSLCILAGTSVGAPLTDQRGVIRPLNKCDIGAYQYTTLLVPTITWTNPAPITYGTPLSGTQLNASADIGGSFAYNPSAGTVLGAGSNQVLMTVFSPADPNTAAGATNTVLLTVLKASQNISFGTIPPQTVNAPPIMLSAAASSGLPVTFSLVSGPALLAGNLLSVGSSPGLVTVRASQSGNVNYNAAPDVDQSFLVLTNAMPVITADPTNVTINLGSDAFFGVSATTAPLNYQWRFNGLDLFGATNSTLFIPRATTNRAGPYRVVVSNPLGAVTSAVAVLTILAPPGVPQITMQPANRVARVGEAASFSIGATGNPTLLYQWYQGASPNTNGLVAGATGSTYTTGPVSTNTSYWVSVRNSLGMVDSTPGSVTVLPAITARLSLTRLSGMAAVYVDGPVGTQYLLQYSTNLTGTNWSTLLDYNQSVNPFIYIDSGSLGAPFRLYRAVAH